MARAIVQKLVPFGPADDNCFADGDVLYAERLAQSRGAADAFGVDAPSGGTSFGRIPRSKVAAGDLLRYLGQYFKVVGVRPAGAFGVMVEIDTEQVPQTFSVAQPVGIGGVALAVGATELVACS